MQTRRTRRGFSLIELILSIGIVGTSLILVVGIFTMLFSGSQKAGDLTAGSVVADGLLSQTVYQIMATDAYRVPFFQARYSSPHFYAGGTYSLNSQVYFYKLYVQDIDLGTTFHNPDTDTAANNNQTYIKRMDIIVWWNDASAASQGSAQNLTMNQRATTMGTQQVRQMRLLWPSGGY